MDPNAPERDTLPPDDSLASDMHELRRALENVGELVGKLISRLTILELAELTEEHRTHIHTAKIEDHEKRLAALEGAA